MDVASLYTNIPQEEGITTICHAYDTFYTATPPIPTHYLREMLRLILQEDSFQFNGKDFLQTHGTAMATKTAVSFANIFMAKIETAIMIRTVQGRCSGRDISMTCFPYGTLIERKLTTSLNIQITITLQ